MTTRGLTATVERRLRRIIARAEIGTLLPSERALAEALDASRTTIRLVYLKLATEGLVAPEHGRGYVVVRRG